MDPTQLIILLNFLGQLFNAQQIQQMQSTVFQKQLDAANKAADPAAFSKMVQGYYKPMSQAAKQNILNTVSPDIAARGWATSPGLAQYAAEQALSPYEMQEQQLAASEAQNALDYPFKIGSGLAGYFPQYQLAGSPI